jgi:hypothetical protein
MAQHFTDESFTQETLRVEIVVPHIFREATQDDIVPLSKPIVSTSGKIMNEVFVPKGTRMIISVIGYNRLAYSLSVNPGDPPIE